MDEQPPRCFFGLCSVRTWATFIAICEFIISILFLLITVFYTIYVIVMAVMRSVDTFYYVNLIIIIIIVILLAIDVRLRMELFEHKYTQTLFWLRIYVTIFIFTMFILIINVMGYFIYQDNIKENVKKIWQLAIISCIIFGILLVPYYYPVHQYYKYEKMKRQNSRGEHQMMYLNNIELQVVCI